VRNPSGYCVALAVALFPQGGSAGEPVAIVEEVRAAHAAVAFMDYLEEGRVIDLEPNDTLVIGYLASCVREKVTGGRVSIGSEMSSVAGGTMQRARVPCGEGKTPDAKAVRAKAGIVFRDGRKPLHWTVLFGSSPFVEGAAVGTLTIEALDRRGERRDLRIGSDDLLRGRFVDLAKADIALRPGGVYRASLGTQKAYFIIDASAQPSAGPLVGRLLRLRGAN
jgi:hypothetical protein